MPTTTRGPDPTPRSRRSTTHLGRPPDGRGFAAIDRAESTLGQALYTGCDRRRPLGPDAFEALIARLTSDTAARENVQTALSRLRSPAGYDLWWLAQPDALQSRPWHIIFPIVGGAMLVPVLLAFVWPGTLFLLLAGAVLNLYIRVMSATRIGALVGSFRQVGPLLTAADAIGTMPPDGIERIVGSLGHLAAHAAAPRAVGRPRPRPGELRRRSSVSEPAVPARRQRAVARCPRAARTRRALLQVIAAVGDVDAALGVASREAGTPSDAAGLLAPTRRRPGRLRHPLIDDAVPNSRAGPVVGVLITVRTCRARRLCTWASTWSNRPSSACILLRSPVLRVHLQAAAATCWRQSYCLVEVESVLSLIQASAEPAPCCSSRRAVPRHERGRADRRGGGPGRALVGPGPTRNPAVHATRRRARGSAARLVCAVPLVGQNSRPTWCSNTGSSAGGNHGTPSRS